MPIDYKAHIGALEGMRSEFMAALMAPYGDYNSDKYKNSVAEVVELLGNAQAAILRLL